MFNPNARAYCGTAMLFMSVFHTYYRSRIVDGWAKPRPGGGHKIMTYLQNHCVLSTVDLDEVREFTANLLAPHHFGIKGEGASLQARVAVAQCGGLSLSHMTFGNVGIDVKSPEEDMDKLLLYVVTSGAGVVRQGNREWEFVTGSGIMRDMARSLEASEEGFGALALSLSKKHLRNHARTLVGDEVDLIDLAFNPEIHFTAPGGALVRNTLHYIAEALDGPLRERDNPMVAAQMQDLLLTQVLTLLPNSYQDVLHGHLRASVVPRYVKRARDYIHAHADKKIGLAEIAEAAGCSYRTLQKGFMDALSHSPMAYLRIVRLKRVRSLLQAGGGESTVAHAAKVWGFTNMGRFARAYADQFGELPSDTVRRRT